MKPKKKTTNHAPVYALSSVSTDDQGLPGRFRVLGWGISSFTQKGVKLELNFTKAHAENIVAEYDARSSDFPLDCEHLAYQVAKQLGIEEHQLDAFCMEKAAIGWWKPEVGEDGLYAVVTKWGDVAQEILKNKLWRYFSPVIRGIGTDALRVTSIAITNIPALDQLDELVASAEADSIIKKRAVLVLNQTKTKTKGINMNKLYAALIGAFGPTAVALSGEGELTNVDELAACVTKFHQEHSDLAKTVRDTLALSAETSIDSLKGSLIASLAKGKDDAVALSAVTTERDDLLDAAEVKAHADLMASGKASGQLVGTDVEAWAKTMNVVALSAWLKNAPVMVTPSRIVGAEKPGEVVALSAEDTETFSGMGLTVEDIKKYGGQ